MPKKWFQYKETAAGDKRLLLTWWIYKTFGIIPVRIIAFFVVLTVFLTSKEKRKASASYFKTLSEYANKNYFWLINSIKQFVNYGNSLVDKIISFSGNFDRKRLLFANSNDEKMISNILTNEKGIFFITTHIGNVEILRILLMSEKYRDKPKVNIFMQSDACKIFNEFLKKFEVKVNLEIFPVEDISVGTAFQISEKLQNGEMVFMSGDRISAQNTEKIYESKFLNKKINLPVGTLRFALSMDCPIFFVVCAKEFKNYKVYFEEFLTSNVEKKEKLEELKIKYTKFLEKYTLVYPTQFYNFFDIFQD